MTLLLVQRPLDGQLQFFVDQRLGEEVEGAQADGFDGRLDRAVAGDHDDGRGRLLLAAIGQHVEAVVVAQADVGQHQVVGLAIDGRGGLGQAGRRVGLVALVAEPVGHRGQQMPIVVHQEQRAALLHAKHPGSCHCCSLSQKKLRYGVRLVNAIGWVNWRRWPKYVAVVQARIVPPIGVYLEIECRFGKSGEFPLDLCRFRQLIPLGRGG